jgi:sugar lactone lactonase YvrE
MRAQSAVAVGSPAPRLLLIATVIALLALGAGIAVIGSNLLRQEPRPIWAFSARFSAPGAALGAPGNLGSDPAGNLWAADHEHDRFAIFKPDGTFVEFWGQGGTAEGSFNLQRPSNGDGYGMVAFQADGSFYVLDVGNFRVQQFDANRMFVRAWGSEGTEPLTYTDPSAIAIGADGSVYILDDARKVVEHVTRDGALIADVPVLQDLVDGNFSTNALAVDEAGYLYVSRTDKRIEKVDPQGRVLVRFGLSGPGTFTAQANSITFDAHGRLMATQGPAIARTDTGVHVYEADGTFLLGIGPEGTKEGQLSFPTGVVLDRKGNLFVADPGAPGGGAISKFELGPPLYP